MSHPAVNNSPRDVLEEIEQKKHEMYEQHQRMERLAREKSQAEKEYRVTRAKKIAELRESGVTATLTKQRADGDEQVAEVKRKRDEKKDLYNIARDKAEDIRLDLNLLRSKLTHMRAEAENVY